MTGVLDEVTQLSLSIAKNTHMLEMQEAETFSGSGRSLGRGKEHGLPIRFVAVVVIGTGAKKISRKRIVRSRW